MPKSSKSKPENHGRRAGDAEAETRRMARTAPSGKQEVLRDTERLQRLVELGAEARLVDTPVISGRLLRLRLPVVIDSSNARVLRRRVLACLPHCQAMELDADRLDCLGDVGCAYLWQILNVARRGGVDVVMVNVSQRVHDALERAHATDSARLVATADGDLAAVALEECETELRISGKTLRLRPDSPVTQEAATTTQRSRTGSWTERFVLKLMPRRKSA